ncbi:MAG: CvpA family protein, partial [Chthoniobacterales bacterium]
AVVTILWSTWVGWRRGVVRAILSLAGMFAGAFVGMAVAAVVPTLFFGVLAGFVVGIGIWIGVSTLGALVFKRTEHQRSVLVKVLYGGGGAVVGAFLGVTIVWGGLFFVRGLGAFAEPRFGDVAKYYGVPEPGAFEGLMVKIKTSIEDGRMAGSWEAFDPMPESTYRLMNKVGRLASDPSAVSRLLEQPEIREITGDENFADVAADPRVAEAARTGEVSTVLLNERLIAAARDPDLIAKLKKIELEPLLDRALGTQPDPAVEP